MFMRDYLKEHMLNTVSYRALSAGEVQSVVRHYPEPTKELTRRRRENVRQHNRVSLDAGAELGVILP